MGSEWEAAGLIQFLDFAGRPLLWTLCELDQYRVFATSFFRSSFIFNYSV